MIPRRPAEDLASALRSAAEEAKRRSPEVSLALLLVGLLALLLIGPLTVSSDSGTQRTLLIVVGVLLVAIVGCAAILARATRPVTGEGDEGGRLVLLQDIRGKDIFATAIKYLETAPRHQVLIYAPTGVWVDDETKEIKRKWFKTIARGLRNYEDNLKGVAPLVETFKGIYGLPPRANYQLPEDRELLARDLRIFEDLVSEFAGCSNAELFYLEADPEVVPGTGAIVIDDAIANGFALQANWQKVDYCYMFEDHKVADAAREWFATRTELAGKRVLHRITISEKVRIGDVMNKIRERWGVPGELVTIG